MNSSERKVFVLSPASSAGKRAALLLSGNGASDCAGQLRLPRGAPLGEVFSFMSGLYFRGKLSYARAFEAPPPGHPGTLVIVPGRGLVDPDVHIDLDDLRGIAGVPVDLDEPRYVDPLVRDASKLAGLLGADDRVVLLGSVATDKYVGPLLPILNERLVIPEEFVGRGDMSRGGLLLRCVDSGEELSYIPVVGAERRGRRPPKLSPRRSKEPGESRGS